MYLEGKKGTLYDRFWLKEVEKIYKSEEAMWKKKICVFKRVKGTLYDTFWLKRVGKLFKTIDYEKE